LEYWPRLTAISARFTSSSALPESAGVVDEGFVVEAWLFGREVVPLFVEVCEAEQAIVAPMAKTAADLAIAARHCFEKCRFFTWSLSWLVVLVKPT
jgi:hypothetical protein